MIDYTAKELAAIFTSCTTQDDFEKTIRAFYWLICHGFMERSFTLQNIALNRLKQIIK